MTTLCGASDYLLSATEYAMPDCYLILEQVLADLAALDGVILYSMFMLPADTGRRRQIYRRLPDAVSTPLLR